MRTSTLLVRFALILCLKKLGVNPKKCEEGRLRFFDGQSYIGPRGRSSETHVLVYTGKLDVIEYSSDPREPPGDLKSYSSLHSFLSARVARQIAWRRTPLPSQALFKHLRRERPDAWREISTAIETNKIHWDRIEVEIKKYITNSIALMLISKWTQL